MTESASTPAPTSRGPLLRNIASNWGAFAFSAVVNFFLSPYVVHKLGDAAYGVWALLVALVGYLGLLDLGIRSAVTRYVARYHASSQHEEASKVASSALTIFCMAGVAAIVIAATMAVFVGSVFNIPPQLITVARLVAVLGGVNVAVSLISGVYGGVVAGMQRLDLSNAVDVAIEAARTIAIFLALRSGHGLAVLAAVQLGFSLARGISAFVMSRKLYPELRVRLGERSREHIRLIFSFSIAASVMQASGMLIAYSDSIVIGAFLPIAMVTYFSIAVSLTNYARVLISGISQAITPLASALEGAGRHDEVPRTILNAAQLATVIALPMCLTFILRGQSFIGLWMGEEYAARCSSVLWVLSVALVFAASYQVNTATMMGIGKHRGLVPVFIIEALTNLLLCVLLIKRFGIVGVAWGIAVPRLFVSLVVAPIYANRAVGVSISKFWLRVWVLPFIAFVPFAIISYFTERFWPASNLLVYFLQIAAAMPAAAIGAWYVCLSRSTRSDFVLRFLRPLRSRNRAVDVMS